MRHSLTRVLPYAPDQLFELVGDVRRYPEFVPWITGMEVWNEHAQGPHVSVLDAKAGVGFSFLRERFSTRVRRDAEARQIDVHLLSGPFRKLSNRWNFEPHPVGTLLKFDIDFEFKSRLLDLMLQANFDRAAAKLIGCFETRAMALYPAFKGAAREAAAAPKREPVRAVRAAGRAQA
jgi:coenzyme Q-binding protein COQ10